ncbi:MAG: hypothetical protein LBP58_08060 [Azoarcus sp.]|jgi:hypothetical protein|nr:hypothetical protein [Azoarcus sp.]
MEHTSRRLARCSVALLCLMTASVSPAAEGRYVLGIRTGMMVEEAEALIARARPGSHKETVRNHAGKPLGFRYTDTDDPEKRLGKTQIVLGIGNGGRIWFVGQAQNFEVGERPDYATLQKSLLDKYGSPTMPGPAHPPAGYLRIKYGILWSFDAQNKPVPGGPRHFLSADPCLEAFAGDNYSQTWGTHIIVPRRTGGQCGMAISASVSFDAETQRVAAFSVTITDATALYADPVYGEESRQFADKQKKLEKEALGGQRVEL